MAMLAGPRRKQKVINLRAKNNAWSNDSNKFGQRMLEKMGWSSGKGLGAKENGIVEHVVARYKNDEKGLGFEDKNDQWTKHEDDFNALLANLSNAEGSEEKLHSGVSLEVKSKKSKARVHYHKFTRGKDLTRYSEKDLANIFGKKSLKEEEKPEEQVPEDIKSSEQVFTEKGSMEDYFKSKLTNFKSKGMPLYTKNESDDNAEYAFKGFSTNADVSDENETNTHQGLGFSFNNNTANNKEAEIENSNLDEVSESIEESKKIKKKKKKNKHKDIDTDHFAAEKTRYEISEDNSCVGENATNNENESKLRKKSKNKSKLNEEPVQNEQTEELNHKKKKSKNKNSHTESAPAALYNAHETELENYIPKKKKKRKNKESNK